MSAGYAGKILRLDLTTKTTSIIDTEQYEEWGGSRGMATALFWDECEDVTVGCFDPKNVLVICANPLTGTLAPSAGSKIDVVGIGAFGYPIEYFVRSGIGQHFGPMLKRAGWDGIVIKGASDTPAWVNIVNDKVTIEDATDLWGRDVRWTQEELWRRVTGRNNFGPWLEVDGGSQTTQGPSSLVIGLTGENLGRMAGIQHGAQGGATHAGFGAVWGSKNLKAISCLGTGGVSIADPGALIEARDLCLSRKLQAAYDLSAYDPSNGLPGRRASCIGCLNPCKFRRQDGFRNDTQCVSVIYAAGKKVNPGMMSAPDFLGLYGFNAFEVYASGTTYVKALYDMGIIGPGTAIDTAPLPMDKFGTTEYAEAHARALANREGIGDYLADGVSRLAATLGRWEEDTASGLLSKSEYGYEWHWTLPEANFAYCSLFDTRDSNAHDFQRVFNAGNYGSLTAEECVNLLSQLTIPYTGDIYMFDWSHNDVTGIYSEHRAKSIGWMMRYDMYFKHSMGFCDWVWPIFIDPRVADMKGLTPETEIALVNAVTGRNMTFADCIATGGKILNLTRAILTLQGRHRDNEKFAEYMYTPAGSQAIGGMGQAVEVSVYNNGEWSYDWGTDFYFDKDGVETLKTHYYNFEGWDPSTGYPTRETLEELDLGSVADALESAGKLGS